MAQPLTTQQLLQTVIDNLDEIAARGTFCDADVLVTDGLDDAQRKVQAALDWLGHDTPCMSRDDWQPSLSSAQLGVARGGSLWL